MVEKEVLAPGEAVIPRLERELEPLVKVRTEIAQQTRTARAEEAAVLAQVEAAREELAAATEISVVEQVQETLADLERKLQGRATLRGNLEKRLGEADNKADVVRNQLIGAKARVAKLSNDISDLESDLGGIGNKIFMAIEDMQCLINRGTRERDAILTELRSALDETEGLTGRCVTASTVEGHLGHWDRIVTQAVEDLNAWSTAIREKLDLQPN